MSTSGSIFRPSLSKSSTGHTSASESRSERASSPVLEEREPNLIDRVKERMQLRPRSRSDSYSSTATTLNQFEREPCEAPPMQRHQSSPLAAEAAREEQKKKNRRSNSNDTKPAMKRASRSTFNDVGRHSNEWLFGGFSVKDTARGLLKRRDS